MGIDLIDPPKESMGNRSKSNGRSSTFMLNFPQAPPRVPLGSVEDYAARLDEDSIGLLG